MFKTKKLLLALTIVVSLIAAGCGSDGDETTVALSGNQTSQPPVETAPPVEAAPEDIVDVAISAGDFPTLIAAVQAAGLVETLKSEGPFTVFAPTEDAFAAALEALGLTAEELLADVETLTAVLTYHVVPGKVMAGDLTGAMSMAVATVQGAEISVTENNGAVTINEATVVAADIEASNGVIHVIDQVLLPPVEAAPEDIVDVAISSGVFLLVFKVLDTRKQSS